MCQSLAEGGRRCTPHLSQRYENRIVKAQKAHQRCLQLQMDGASQEDMDEALGKFAVARSQMMDDARELAARKRYDLVEAEHLTAMGIDPNAEPESEPEPAGASGFQKLTKADLTKTIPGTRMNVGVFLVQMSAQKRVPVEKLMLDPRIARRCKEGLPPLRRAV